MWLYLGKQASYQIHHFDIFGRFKEVGGTTTEVDGAKLLPLHRFLVHLYFALEIVKVDFERGIAREYFHRKQAVATF